MSTARPLESALAGCTIIVVADRRSVEVADALERRGAVVHRTPVPRLDDRQDRAELRSATELVIAEPPDAVVVTTGSGFRDWVDVAREQGRSAPFQDALRRARLVATGPRAQAAILRTGLVADWVAETGTTAEVGAHLRVAGVRGTRIVVQHHSDRDDGLESMLHEAGAEVRGVVARRWEASPRSETMRRTVLQAANGDADAVAFTSASAAAAWLAIAEVSETLDRVRRRSETGRLLLASAGQATTALLNDADLEPSIDLGGPDGSLANAVLAHFDDGRAPSLLTDAGRVQVRSGGVLIDGRFIPLSRSSAALLDALAAAGGRVLSRAQLSAVLGAERSAHAVEAAVARLRVALGGSELIHTVVKRGYRLAVVED